MTLYRLLGPVALIEINNPPVNALSSSVRQGLENGIKKSARDARVKAIVISGKDQTFIAGADIKEFGKFRQSPSLTEVGRVIEASQKPVVAAIAGVALGGGLEIALFCHYRLAVKSAKVGFPEVQLGILPGGEGTQRLPRLTGLPVAMEMIMTGRHVPATEAFRYGILDKLIDKNIVEESMKFALSVINSPHETRRLRNMPVKGIENVPAIVNDALALARRRYKGFIAPVTCIKAVRASVELPFEKGCEREKELFQELITSGQAKAMMYAFFAERAASKWQLPSGENSTNTNPLPVKTTAVIGAGTMGSGIAVSLLTSGFPVILLEQNKQQLDKGVQTIHAILERSMRSKRLTPDGMKKCLSLLTPADDIDCLKHVDLVIEAVFENLDLKKEIFAKLDTICKKDAVLCTNTSTLDIDKIASATTRPDKVVGSHFFAPAFIMRLLENVYGSKTSGTTVSTVMQLGKKMGKVPVLVGTCHGFVANRTLMKYSAETRFLLEEGALPHEVDQAMEDFGMAMGRFRTSDLSGIDVGYRIFHEQAKAEGYTVTMETRHVGGERYCSLPHKLYNLQRLGQKTGKGWYRYDKPGGKQAMVDEEVTQLILDHSTKLGIVRRKISAQEIVERCLFAVISEAFHCLEDGVVAKAEDVDVIWLYGLGFPRYRGGPLFYASQLGLKKVYDRICYYHKQFPDVSHWMPSELFRRLALAENNTPMSSWNLKASSKL
ncbi:peroxisomal bifunctional enzyme-like isoform X2 [Gigantopelta aegis]|uniref:peroxisomal bifunctional enzyme-like isoform X2 n=1 Tax=Gigantopelta aegis TaxID=1735272 RepID=UPI001B88AD35|nr:peroxisomal bifunctional enzyme-like isoform X2 [Gigantopelta aegis]